MTTGIEQLDPWQLCAALERNAKWWWAAALWVRLAGFLAASVSILSGIGSHFAAYLVALLTLLAEIAALRSDWAKAMAQRMKRRLEMLDSFGWRISNAEFSDLLARTPKRVRSEALQLSADGPYFASKASHGPKRALENASESAWFSKHLSENMGHICLGVIILTALAAIVALITSIQSIPTLSSGASVARVVTSVFMLLLSLGLVRMTLGYYVFASTAGRTEDQAETLLASGDPTEIDALKVVHEYQLSRALSPLMPEWIWRWRRGDLNKLWESLRKRPAP